MTTRPLLIAAIIVAAIGSLAAQQRSPVPPRPVPLPPPTSQAPPPPAGDDGYRFKSGVELVNVTATVSDATGRFVPGLLQDDFTVYEDNVPQEISYFSAERVPVSLGLVIDTSGSMAGEKMDDAKSALNRFVYDLLDERDELFLYRFSDHPTRNVLT